MSNATLKSIAKATGFSVTTVSRALGGFDDVNEATRHIIIEEARRQGYTPNLPARALQTQKTQTIGLIVPAEGPTFPDPFFGEFVAGIGSEAGSSGFDLLLSTHTPPDGEINAYHRMVAGRRVDGLILLRTRHDDARIRYLVGTTMPFATFGRTTSAQDYVYIDVDGVAGQRELTQHFIDLGHRRIAFVTPPHGLMFTHYRLEGFREAMARNGLTVDQRLVIEGDLTEHGGREAARMLLDLPNPPTAIMTGNDLMAFGVMGGIQERGLRVGEDIAVGGFDDVPSAEHLHPGLTTIHQPIYQIGQQLARNLLRLIARQALAERATLIKPQLIVRRSSGPLRR